MKVKLQCALELAVNLREDFTIKEKKSNQPLIPYDLFVDIPNSQLLSIVS